jgi:hypothetical protein
MYGYLSPIASIALTAVFLGESVGLAEVVGGAIILAGVWVSSGARQRDRAVVPLERPPVADPEGEATPAAASRAAT